jgi:hypothetical protein
VQVTSEFYLDTVQVLTERYLDTLQLLTKCYLDIVRAIIKPYRDTVRVKTQGCIVQSIIQNNLAVTASVVSAFNENICLKTKKTP